MPHRKTSEAGGMVEGLARNLAREGMDEYTFRVAPDGRPMIAHRFEFSERWIDDDGIEEILATVERVMRRVRQSADDRPASPPLHLLK